MGTGTPLIKGYVCVTGVDQKARHQDASPGVGQGDGCQAWQSIGGWGSELLWSFYSGKYMPY